MPAGVVSVQRVYAQRKIARVLAERLAEAAQALKVGDPTLPDTAVGPLIREKEVARVDLGCRKPYSVGPARFAAAAAVGGKGDRSQFAGTARRCCAQIGPVPFPPPPTTCYAPTVLLDRPPTLA